MAVSQTRLKNRSDMVPPISDLVVDSKLETHFHQNGTIHTYLDVTRGRQRVSRQEHWRWKRDLGQGGYGRVWLETCTEGKTRGSSRAVKMVRKQLGSSCAIDYNRELEAIAKFSHHKVTRNRSNLQILVLPT